MHNKSEKREEIVAALKKVRAALEGIAPYHSLLTQASVCEDLKILSEIPLAINVCDDKLTKGIDLLERPS